VARIQAVRLHRYLPYSRWLTCVQFSVDADTKVMRPWNLLRNSQLSWRRGHCLAINQPSMHNRLCPEQASFSWEPENNRGNVHHECMSGGWAATNWYFRGGVWVWWWNDVTCWCTYQMHTFLKISGGNSPIAHPLVAGLSGGVYVNKEKLTRKCSSRNSLFDLGWIALLYKSNSCSFFQPLFLQHPFRRFFSNFAHLNNFKNLTYFNSSRNKGFLILFRFTSIFSRSYCPPLFHTCALNINE